MNINTTSSAPAPVPLHKAGGTSARTREQGDMEQNAASGADFQSMLHALTEPVAETSPSADRSLVQAESAVQGDPAAQDADLARAIQTAPTTLLPTDAATSRHLVDGALTPTAQSPGLRSRQAHGAADPAAGTNTQVGGSGDLQAAPEGKATGNLVGRNPHMASPDPNDRAQQLARAAAQATDSTGALADKGHAAKEPDMSLLRPLVSPQAAVGVVSMFESGLAGLRTGPGARAVERGQDRHAAAHPANGFVGWTDSAPTGTSNQSANPVYAPTASTPVPAATMAQKMHFWVAGGVQSAELQLDAFGGGSVDVRIAVKGDEAMVTFRSDQPQARQLLLDAMPQLKELLAGEGLVLSGGFVGGSAQQRGEGGDTSPEPRSGGVRAGPVRDTLAPAPPPGALRGVPGAAIDLFV